ncbi:MAG TPA: FtsX-like permease family protein [Lapillicoccus sp.]|nr:FtsX-like permease family protein [Lapillicoccus sp.]
MTGALTVWWALRRGVDRESRVPAVLAVVAFAVATAALLVCAGGLLAFRSRADVSGSDSANYYVTLALVACAVMVVPILTLGGVAARLAAARRDQRLATLRLSGATSGQVVLMTLAEAVGQALLGGLLGTVLYAAVLPLLAQLSFQGRPFTVGELWVGFPVAVLVLLGVVLLAAVSGLVGLTRVVIGPLGVTARVSPPRLRWWRALAVIVALAVWLAVSGARHDLGVGVVLAVMVGVVATVNVVGPYLVMLLGFLVAALSRRFPTLLAARRLVDDPRSTWRAVSAVGLGVIVAGLSTMVAGTSDSGGPDGYEFLGADMATGAYLTLAIIAVVSATSTGVVQAARVLDQRDQYRALALAGAEASALHAARTREVALPLGVTVVVAGGMTLMLLVPFSAVIGPELLARFVVAVVAAMALMVAAVLVSGPLVRTVCTVP